MPDTAPDTAPDTVSAHEPSEDERIEAMAFDELKTRARAAGLKFHPSIGADTLSTKLAEHLAAQAQAQAEATHGPEGVSEADVQALAAPRGEAPDVLVRRGARLDPAKALVRVRVQSMDPMKKEYEGEIISASNAVIGTVKRFVQFGVPWHIEQILLNTLRDKQFQAFKKTRDHDGNEIKTGKLMPAYAIEVLPHLSAEEMDKLRQRQLAQRTGSDE